MHIVENEDNIDDALFTWNKMFSEVADQHAPVKRRRVKGTPLPWVNSQISDTMKERDWAHRKARNRTQRVIGQCMQSLGTKLMA